MYVNTNELPEIIQRALKSFGYGRRDINLEARDSIDIGGGANKGSRAVLIVVNIAVNQVTSETRGSWGGQNPFVKTIDDVSNLLEIPDNFVVIFGGEGGQGSYASLYANSKTVAPLLPAPSPELTRGQLNALYVFRALKSSARKEELLRLGVTLGELGQLVLDGYLVRKGNGTQITVKGKNASPRNVIYG
jgi:hypothetical protein